MRRIWASLAVTVGLCTLVLAPSAHAGTAEVANDAAWVLSGQLPDGSIANYADQLHVRPYLANYAALGLARATQLTGDSRYVAGAWAWLTWYQAHEDLNGFVSDYDLVGGTLVSTGGMDSTDAYAGTYLLAVRRAWKATGDTVRLATLGPGVRGAVSAIEATQDLDGLTWAKPSWHVKYLMDQAEVYAGLRAAVDIANALGDAALAQRASTDAQRVATGVGRLWNTTTNSYDWAVTATGVHQSTNWSVFYPDAQQQMWAVAFGLASGGRAKNLVAAFGRYHPYWSQPTQTELYDSGTQPVGYWPVDGWAYLAVGQTATSLAGAANIRAGAVAANRAWPYTTGNGGQLVTLETSDTSYLIG